MGANTMEKKKNDLKNHHSQGIFIIPESISRNKEENIFGKMISKMKKVNYGRKKMPLSFR